ncbi:MAG: hypothetical protein HKP27_00285 [Myxococcales bacterium]|nr:hypothetical protein [Myxococcales bacterium]
MSAQDHPLRSDAPEDCIETTLLALVEAVDSVAETEEEVVATVLSLLGSGRVRLALRSVPDAA